MQNAEARSLSERGQYPALKHENLRALAFGAPTDRALGVRPRDYTIGPEAQNSALAGRAIAPGSEHPEAASSPFQCAKTLSEYPRAGSGSTARREPRRPRPHGLIHVLNHPEVGAKIGRMARRLSLAVPEHSAHEWADAEQGCA